MINDNRVPGLPCSRPKNPHEPHPRCARQVAAPLGRFLAAGSLLLTSALAIADKAHVIDAQIEALGSGQFRIEATIEHADTGWEHYANAWSVFSVDGERLGTRELAHPHVQEQPFTRALTLELPKGIERVVIRAADSVHGEGGDSVELEVPAGP